MSDAIAAFAAARDAVNANIFGGQVGDDSPDLQRSLETFINSVAPAAEAAALLPPTARPRVQPQPRAQPGDYLWPEPSTRRRGASAGVGDIVKAGLDDPRKLLSRFDNELEALGIPPDAFPCLRRGLGRYRGQ